MVRKLSNLALMVAEIYYSHGFERRRGGVLAREDEPRRDERAEQQAPAPQGPVLPPPPPVDYGVFMQGLVQAMQTQAHTQAALQAQLEAQERADVWWASLLRTQFEDRAIDVAWDEFVRFFRAKFIPEHVQDRMLQEFLSLAQGCIMRQDFLNSLNMLLISWQTSAERQRSS
ncbi:hypothetical protein Taro_004078 [Colocasia esculenta]|uniref:Retrotransposon gag domain-containing protein n=1 Tax=Colocasia esculenta TaxID=4460 RepID=A0A843TP17_COLES|nr:hypothetical protein [Colocasia esculenta]